MEVGWCHRVELKTLFVIPSLHVGLIHQKCCSQKQVLARPLSEAHSDTPLLHRVQLVLSVPSSSIALRHFARTHAVASSERTKCYPKQRHQVV